MVIGLRFLAFIVDLPFCFFSLFVFLETTVWMLNHAEPVAWLLAPLWFAMFFAWPFIHFGVLTGIWGRTPGRWICRLKVTHINGQPPGLWRGLGRETLKLLALASGVGATLCCYQVLTHGITWYDQLCETQVVHTPWIRMTATQRNFRKRYKPPRF